MMVSTIGGVWDTIAGGQSKLAIPGTGMGTYLAGQTPSNLSDNQLSTKYTSRGNSNGGNNSIAGLNTGFHVTVAQCQPILSGFSFGNAFPNSEREPVRVTVEGTNCTNLSNCASWTLIYTGSTGLDTAATTAAYGNFQMISNTISFKSYRFLVIQKRAISSHVSYGEVKLYGYSSTSSSSANQAASSKCRLLTFLVRPR
jgi:hypothetical protein